jgi:hypothetical protein
MPGSTPLLTLPQVEAIDTAYLRQAAEYWQHTANVWEEAFTEVHERMSSPGSTPWKGRAAAAAQERSYTDLIQVRRAVYQLHEAAEIARRADEQLQASKELVLDAVTEARADGFDVGADYSVTDNQLIKRELMAPNVHPWRRHAGDRHPGYTLETHLAAPDLP